jgi:tetratricopeptide (TPR) repeat protein
VKHRAAIWVLCLVGLAAGTTASYKRLSVWRSEDALFGDALAKNPRSWTAMINLTKSACERGRFTEGLILIEKALQLSPAEPAALADKAFCLYNTGRVDEVLQLRKALLSPDVQRALDQNDVVASGLANTIAGALFQQGRPEEGWAFLCQALAVNPFDANLQQNATDIAREFAARGVEARCPDRAGWAAFVRLNVARRPRT